MKRLKLWTMAIACILMLVTPLQAFAASPKVKVVVDGQAINLDVAPYIENNRVLVPVRGVFEILGLEVKWNQASKTATIKGDSSTIVMQLGKKEVKVNGKAVKIDTPVSLHKNSLFIPVRFVTEHSGGNVKWNQATKTVTLSSSKVDSQTKDFLTKVAQVKMNSFSMNAKIKQSMNFMGESMNADMALDMDVVLDPIGFYQSLSMTMDGLEGEDLSTKAYMTKDGYYTYDSLTNQWMKFDDDMVSELQDLSDMQMDPNEQLELMTRYYQNVKIVEKANTYELHMSISGEGFQDLLNEVLSLTDLGLEEELLEGFDMNIKKMDMVSVYDKQTLYPLSGSLDSDITMVMEGEEMTMTQKADFTYSNINQLKEITIPAEVIDSAIPFEEAEEL